MFVRFISSIMLFRLFPYWFSVWSLSIVGSVVLNSLAIIIVLQFLFLAVSSSWEGNGTPLQYSCLENPTDGGAWWAAVHGVTESRTWLSDFIFTFHFPALEKEMATHSSILAWRIPGTAEPGGLQSVGSHRVGHDWGDLAAAAAVVLAAPCSLWDLRSPTRGQTQAPSSEKAES